MDCINERLAIFIDSLEFSDVRSEIASCIDCYVPQPPIRRVVNGLIEEIPNGIKSANLLCVVRYTKENEVKYRLISRNNEHFSVNYHKYYDLYINGTSFPSTGKCFTLNHWLAKYNEIIERVSLVLWFYVWYNS